MSISTLSTNTSGAPSLMLFTPRILKDISAPGWPDVPVTCNPGIAPISTLLTEVTGRSPNISSIFTLLTAPVRLAFFCTPYPTTTTSSKVSVSSFKTIFSSFLFPVFISSEAYPM